MAKLIFENTNNEVELPDNSDITPFCEEEGVPIACCEGICGACLIEIIEGENNLNDLTETEKNFLSETSKKQRLACQCIIKNGIVKIKY